MSATRFRSLLLATILVAASASCDSALAPTGVSTPEVPVSGSLVGGLLHPTLSLLLSCPAQPAAADTEAVGPAGGTLVIGPHRLVIPAGALDSTVTIIGLAPSDSVVSVQFQPEGLQFDPRHLPRLTLDYSQCGLVRNLLPKRIVFTTDALTILDLLPSLDDLLHEQVSANIHHFSRYAVAW
jgi:hypothetical protein